MTFVSNPASGELVKGHAIVLAELGPCPYRGEIVRHPELFTGQWSKPRRAEHLVVRLAFMQELFSSWEVDTVTLYVVPPRAARYPRRVHLRSCQRRSPERSQRRTSAVGRRHKQPSCGARRYPSSGCS